MHAVRRHLPRLLLGLAFLLAVAASTRLAAGPSSPPAARSPLPPGVTVHRDLAYGPHPDQRLDVYRPSAAQRSAAAPVLVMVHGGGWKRGDKAMPCMYANKVARWVPAGVVFVSVNYRLLPDADPLAQAGDVFQAVNYVEAHARAWGGDPRAIVLMGHSAGAHLVALLNAAPSFAPGGRRAWLGCISLDSGALDVPAIMESRHLPLYDPAFGTDPDFWRTVSPMHQLQPGAPPILVVYSSRRPAAVRQTHAFAARARDLGVRCVIRAEDLTHREINETLGLPAAYTAAVEDFLRSLDPRFVVRR